MQVEVYLNRRAMGKSRKRIYSLRHTLDGLVRFQSPNVLLQDVELVVQQAGRQDTLRRLEGHLAISKTVHAFLRGTLLRRGRNAKVVSRELGLSMDNAQVSPVGYDPRKTQQWVSIDGYQMPDDVSANSIITVAQYAYLHADGILVLH
ncbi:hypothetical protein [Alteromonas sp.]|uniref:hypothetical protein n=1 Tax=Alteromonas sp. TaxID=232 RepID=UPI000C5D63CE|nr:hypothetical protein [Alteromonas sp.]MAI36461.1 hypothetical protein [Alteromonas sp.]